MELAIFGVNHVSAPLSVREVLYLDAARQREFLEAWRAESPEDQVVALCTCNRTEVYGFGFGERETRRAIFIERLSATTRLPPDQFETSSYFHTDTAALRHLFRVASGLDSMVIGESQILSQLRQAYATAREFGATGSLMNTLMDRALRVGKRARAETEIGVGNLSVASVAVGLAGRVFDNLARRTVLLLGAGETAELVARHLLDAGVRDLRIANRTRERAEEFAARFLGAKVVPFEPLGGALAEADIVVCATAAPKPLVTPELARDLVRRRGGRLLVFLDLAVPRNVDPAVESLGQVIAYDIDSLKTVCEQSRGRRLAEVAKVEAIVEEEAGKFVAWYARLETDTLLATLRRRFEDIRRCELERHGRKFRPEDRERLDRFTRGLADKFLHDLSTNLRQVNRDSRDGLALLDAVDRLFRLSPDPNPDEGKDATE